MAKFGFLGNIFSGFHRLDDEFFDDLEEKLILADAGATVAEEIVAELRARADTRHDDAERVRGLLVDILTEQLEAAGEPSLHLSTSPSVVLVVGVNGVGKTTSIGKLAAAFTRAGKKVLLSAADTFRAAASEQLGIWAERSGVDIVRHGEGGDPGAVVYDSCAAAKARGADIMLVDTAGRLHNKQNLMNELSKIRKILDRELPGADTEVLLVLDATTGQNGLLQAEAFAKAAGVTGILLTKLDGTAKGGVALAIGKTLGVPVKLVGTGEGINDLSVFEARAFAEELLQ